MDRRTFLAGTGAMLLAAPFAAEAQARKVPWVGVLGATPSDPVLAQAFSKGLGNAGYVDGRNVSIEHHQAGGQPDRLPAPGPLVVVPDTTANGDLAVRFGVRL